MAFGNSDIFYTSAIGECGEITGIRLYHCVPQVILVSSRHPEYDFESLECLHG